MTTHDETPVRLVDELDRMHAAYVSAVNAAVDADDLARAEQLARDYDDEAVRLIATREGKTHLLPITRPTRPDTPLRRLVAQLRARAA